MLQRLCEQTPAIMALAMINVSLKTAASSFEVQAITEKMVVVLKPFEIAKSILCAEKSPTKFYQQC